MERGDVEFVNTTRNGYAKQYLHDQRTFTLEESLDWFDTQHPDWWIIQWDNTRIGYFRLSNHDPETRSIYIGADIAPLWTGRGLSKVAYRKFLPWIARLYDIDKFRLLVKAHNTRAINLYRGLGFLTVRPIYKTYAQPGSLDYTVTDSYEMEYDIRNPGMIQMQIED